MRALLPAFILLAAGCLGTPPAPDADSGGPPAPFEGCARMLVLPQNGTVRTYGQVQVDLAFLNCGDAPVNLTRDDPCDWQAVNVTLRRGEASWVLRGWSATPGGASKSSCSDVANVPRVVQPGEWLNESIVWNGTVVDAWDPCAMPCDPTQGARPMEPGAYVLAAEARTDRGAVRGEANLTLVPPHVPPADPAAKVRFLLNASYRVGETVAVRVENVGDRPYRYRTLYAACDLEYYHDDGRPFRVPPGTHCDLANADALDPGETVTLFNWTLDECTRDLWGCAESAPLPPGTYHVRGLFHAARERHWEPPLDATYAGASFRIEP